MYTSSEKDQSSMVLPLSTTSHNNNVAKSSNIRISRKSHNARLLPSTSLPMTLILLLALLLSLTPATASAHPHPAITDTLVDPQPNSPASFRSELAGLDADGIVLTDARVRRAAWELSTAGAEIPRRENVEMAKRETGSPTHSVTSATSTTSSSKTQEASALPSPFDSNIGSNFASPSCPTFINAFLATPEFKACLPFSILLEVTFPPFFHSSSTEPTANPLPPQSSHSFFETTKSPYLTTTLLDHTCAANSTQCTTYLTALAAALPDASACGADLAAGHPIAALARTALVAYEPLYAASCLKSASGSYCFVDAVTNASSPSDSYVYYLGLGEALPAATQMTCNACLQDTVAVFGAAAANRSQPVAGVYEGAARVVNSFCGPGWVNATLVAEVTVVSGASVVMGMGSWFVVVLLGVLVLL